MSRWTARSTNTPSSSSWSSADSSRHRARTMRTPTWRALPGASNRSSSKGWQRSPDMCELPGLRSRSSKQCRAALEASETEGASLQAQLEELQGRIGDNCGRTAGAKEELAAAERERHGLYRSLQSAGSERPREACLAASLVGALAASAVLLEEAFVELGQSRSDVEALLQKLHGCVDSWQAWPWQATALRQAEEAAAATAAAAGAAAAAAATSAGARPAEPAAGATGRPEEGNEYRAAGRLDGAGGGDGGDAGGSLTIDEALRTFSDEDFPELSSGAKRALAARFVGAQAEKRRSAPY